MARKSLVDINDIDFDSILFTKGYLKLGSGDDRHAIIETQKWRDLRDVLLKDRTSSYAIVTKREVYNYLLGMQDL